MRSHYCPIKSPFNSLWSIYLFNIWKKHLFLFQLSSHTLAPVWSPPWNIQKHHMTYETHLSLQSHYGFSPLSDQPSQVCRDTAVDETLVEPHPSSVSPSLVCLVLLNIECANTHARTHTHTPISHGGHKVIKGNDLSPANMFQRSKKLYLTTVFCFRHLNRQHPSSNVTYRVKQVSALCCWRVMYINQSLGDRENYSALYCDTKKE